MKELMVEKWNVMHAPTSTTTASVSAMPSPASSIPNATFQHPSLPDHMTPSLLCSQSLDHLLDAGALNLYTQTHTHTPCTLSFPVYVAKH